MIRAERKKNTSYKQKANTKKKQKNTKKLTYNPDYQKTTIVYEFQHKFHTYIKTKKEKVNNHRNKHTNTNKTENMSTSLQKKKTKKYIFVKAKNLRY